jgi:hypothetical protein
LLKKPATASAIFYEESSKKNLGCRCESCGPTDEDWLVHTSDQCRKRLSYGLED